MYLYKSNYLLRKWKGQQLLLYGIKKTSLCANIMQTLLLFFPVYFTDETYQEQWHPLQLRYISIKEQRQRAKIAILKVTPIYDNQKPIYQSINSDHVCGSCGPPLSAPYKTCCVVECHNSHKHSQGPLTTFLCKVLCNSCTHSA